jgi:hypothetical protein
VEGTPPDQPQSQEVEESVGSSVDAILRTAREAAAGIVADAERRAEDTRLTVDAYAERVLREAEEEAKRVRATAQAESERRHAAAQDAAQAEAASLESGNSDLRNEADVLASRRDRILRELESIARDLEDAVAGVAPEAPSASLGEALDVRRRS